jgi:ribosomal protein S18 acetylase RimI-like enzyme
VSAATLLPSGLRIRSYRDDDIAGVSALLNVLQEAECRMESSRARWADGGGAYAGWVLQEAAANDGEVLLAETAGGEVVGLAACWRICDDTDITIRPESRPHLYVSELAVHEAWRGRGIAGALLAECARHGRALGLAQMTIGVLAVNAAARRAYAKAGFEDYEMLLRKRL